MDTLSRWQKVIVLFYIIYVFEARCEVEVLPTALFYNLTTTTRADYFALQNQRQFMANIKSLEEQVKNFKINYNRRIKDAGMFDVLVETKLNELDIKLNPLELLDDIHDHCVQKYRNKVAGFATIKTNFAICTQKANNMLPSLVSSMENTIKNLNNHYTNKFANSLKDCKKNYKSEEIYLNCITAIVNETAILTNNHNLIFENQLQTAKCTSTMKIKELFDCYSAHVYSIFTSIGAVTSLIENCISGHEFCPSYGIENEISKGRCPYHLSWHLAESDLNNEKITNPFKGINPTTPCLQINFITKSIVLPN